ncbi:hypothetical protein CI610_03699 [invertebrate metagenome]|uniref:Uncharacterized protein n=1 Tax=invertebrate metagenome TaxID=1711999 RepID=A0A2H9T2D3_9ZZZZ
MSDRELYFDDDANLMAVPELDRPNVRHTTLADTSLQRSAQIVPIIAVVTIKTRPSGSTVIATINKRR